MSVIELTIHPKRLSTKAARYVSVSAQIGSGLVDLRAPQADDAGHVHPAYALLQHSRPGDIVFHYQQPDGIVAWSRVAGDAFEDRIVWGARGRAAQRAGVRPYERSGWRVPLVGPFILAQRVSLAELRQREGAIATPLSPLNVRYPAPSIARFSSPTGSHYGLPRLPHKASGRSRT
jgi:hypothetical protein